MTVHAVVGINISVGNAAMQTTDDISRALMRLAKRIDLVTLAEIESRSVPLWDDNGNIVGYMQVTGYSEEKDEED